MIVFLRIILLFIKNNVNLMKYLLNYFELLSSTKAFNPILIVLPIATS